MDNLTIGVLALQGDVSEHIKCLKSLSVEAVAVKYEHQLEKVDGIIIPGGESTTINRLTEGNQLVRALFDAIKRRSEAGMPVYGTCMGSIMLAKNLEDSNQETLKLMDIIIKRNAYGSQKASFETSLQIDKLGKAPYQAIFIRAPLITGAADDVEILAGSKDDIYMARQGNYLVTTFHPELTDDLRIHQLFIQMVKSSLLQNKQSPNSADYGLFVAQ